MHHKEGNGIDDVDSWRPHHTRSERKFTKTHASVGRQYEHGVPLGNMVPKLVRLHRLSTGFDGNGSTRDLLMDLGILPEVAPPHLGGNYYTTHPVADKEDIPTTEEARFERDQLQRERAVANMSEDTVTLLDAERRADELEHELLKAYERVTIF